MRSFKKTYTTAYDENGRVTIWAEFPQELANAELRIQVYEITDIDREERIAKAEKRRLRPKKAK